MGARAPPSWMTFKIIVAEEIWIFWNFLRGWWFKRLGHYGASDLGWWPDGTAEYIPNACKAGHCRP